MNCKRRSTSIAWGQYKQQGEKREIKKQNRESSMPNQYILSPDDKHKKFYTIPSAYLHTKENRRVKKLCKQQFSHSS